MIDNDNLVKQRVPGNGADIINIEEVTRKVLHKKENCDNVIEICAQTIKEMQEVKKILDQHPYSIKQNPNDGNWYTYVKKEDGTRKLVKRKTQAKMKAYLSDYYNHLEGIKQPCFGAVFNEWIAEKEKCREVKPNTLTRYKNDYKRFFSEDDPFCQIKVKDITYSDLEKFIKRQICDKELTKKSYEMLKGILRGVFKHAKRERYILWSITDFFNDLVLPKNIFQHKHKNDEEEVFSESETKLLLNYLSATSTLVNLGIAFNFYAGLRVGELSALKPCDVTGNVLLVQRTEMSYKNQSGKYVCVVSDSTKTECGTRKIIIPEQGRAILDRIFLIREKGEYLFSENGERMHTRKFQYALTKACKQVGIKPRSMHKIRKTYASILLENGVSETIVKKQMGHTDIATTQNYYHFDRSDADKKYAEINRAVNY